MTHSKLKTPGYLGFVGSLLAIALTLGACEAPGPNVPRVDTAEWNYPLGPGDKVKIKVFGDQSLSGDYQLDGQGAFTMPLVGTVKAAGLTSNQLETQIEKNLSEYMRSPDVSLEILSYRPFYIVGEIRKPGSYPYVDGMTVINAVAIAGGFTYRAREESFYIQTKDEQKQVPAGKSTRVMPGDVIIVRERYF